MFVRSMCVVLIQNNNSIVNTKLKKGSVPGLEYFPQAQNFQSTKLKSKGGTEAAGEGGSFGSEIVLLQGRPGPDPS
eukprot:1754163-Rhodomonas_salina.3